MEINQLVNTAIRAALLAGEKIMEVYTSGDFGIVEKQDYTPLTIADRKAHDLIAQLLTPTHLPLLSEEGILLPYSDRSLWKTFWLVDPLDGTKEFISCNGEFTVNIALISENQSIAGVVYCPVSKEMYVGIVGKGAWKMINPGDDCTVEQLLAEGTRLPVNSDRQNYRVAVSRTHLDQQTLKFIESLKKEHPSLDIIRKGSSIKFCLIAEGAVDIYPRFAPTMEWDTAAGHAIVKAMGKNIVMTDRETEITYNKENLTNPYFIVL
ncbi:MAG TPA: 3'(2'),5'-bisphosphate nucleotidase CysQ [Prolixibacteraceae bacterium]|nr:3'(2'),5'-bisphosphate nucleotidase CysQ [Prolixibacteraceae bacterium]